MMRGCGGLMRDAVGSLLMLFAGVLIKYKCEGIPIKRLDGTALLARSTVERKTAGRFANNC